MGGKLLGAVCIVAWVAACGAAQSARFGSAQLPSGFFITPLAAPGASFQRMPTHVRPDGSADANSAERALRSPDGTALLVLTSGYNTFFYNDMKQPIKHAVLDPRTGQPSQVMTQNAEWLFLYDIRGGKPILKQSVNLPDSYHGLVWQPDGKRFYVSGGIDDRVYVYATNSAGATADATFAPDAPFILLGHNSGQHRPLPHYDGGEWLGTPIGQSQTLLAAVMGATAAATAGLDVSADGRTLAAVNMADASLSLIDTATRKVTREVRFFTPGQNQAIGELPYWVTLRSDSQGAFARAYVTSQRDGQVLSVGPDGSYNIIKVGGEPNRTVLTRDQSLLYVANGDLDEIEEIDTATDHVRRVISLLRPGDKLLGAGPDGLTLSPGEDRLYVTLSNENALAVVDLRAGRVAGRIPTGWFPADVSQSPDGAYLYVVNTKNVTGPSDYFINLKNDNQKLPPNGHSGYVLALEKAGLLSFPLPDRATLAQLSGIVDANNHFDHRQDDAMMDFLRAHIHHVIYILKENRTYDQVLGDLPQGNGDKRLVEFPRRVTPNHHALAERFALLDNFDSAGDVSGDGWNWMFQGHANVYTTNTVTVAYGNAYYHIPFDWNGSPGNIGVALPDHAKNPGPATVRITTLLDPTGQSAIEPGPKDITADQGADDDGADALGGYIWDSALRAGKSLRHYGAYSDENYYILGSPVYFPIVRHAGEKGVLQSVPLRPALIGHDDPYYRGWDLNTPDQYRFEEWDREFKQFVANGNLPDLEIMTLMMDHFGNFATNVSGLDTPTLQIASNDYAIGQVAEAVSHSPYWKDTAIFILEDDAQDGPDHVDSHRTVAQVISAYTRAGAVISTRYDTTSMVRTIEDILGIGHLGLNDANAAPMSDVFTRAPDRQPYEAIIPGVLCKPPVDPNLVPQCRQPGHTVTQAVRDAHDGAWWAAATRGMDFSRPDRIDSMKFNAILAAGSK
jgi:DNA-binding beta-propeller fold protein YncE